MRLPLLCTHLSQESNPPHNGSEETWRSSDATVQALQRKIATVRIVHRRLVRPAFQHSKAVRFSMTLCFAYWDLSRQRSGRRPGQVVRFLENGWAWDIGFWCVIFSFTIYGSRLGSQHRLLLMLLLFRRFWRWIVWLANELSQIAAVSRHLTPENGLHQWNHFFIATILWSWSCKTHAYRYLWPAHVSYSMYVFYKCK